MPYLEQEQSSGKNLCFPTAIVNVALGLKVVSHREALNAVRQINTALIQNSALWYWGGPNLLLDFGNEDVVIRILEEFLPIKVGTGSDLRVNVSYTQMRADVIARRRSYAIMISQLSHVYAAVPSGNNLCYVDSNEPQRLVSVHNEDVYRRTFYAYPSGLVKTTPVTPLPPKR